MKREQRVFGNEDTNNNAKRQMSNAVSQGENKFPTRLSGEYNNGYRKAIMDVIEAFSYIEPDLRHHRKGMTFKTARKLLKCILENREKIRDGWRGFIRFNGKKNDFEWFGGK